MFEGGDSLLEGLEGGVLGFWVFLSLVNMVCVLLIALVVIFIISIDVISTRYIVPIILILSMLLPHHQHLLLQPILLLTQLLYPLLQLYHLLLDLLPIKLKLFPFPIHSILTGRFLVLLD